MELNFSSVETIPGLNASAAFQVDSGKVFKEDVDMVPTIIDKSLSYMPWGGDNMMPYNILKLIEDDEPSARQSLQHESPRQRWRADVKPLSDALDLPAVQSRSVLRQRSAETVLVTIFGKTVSQHTILLAIVEERADTDAANASQETVKLSVSFPLAVLRVLLADDVEIFMTFFTN